MKKYLAALFALFSLSCNKEVAEPITGVEITGFVIEKFPNDNNGVPWHEGKHLNLNFGIYDDIGESFYSELKSNVSIWPAIWEFQYQVPNFKNDYAVLLNVFDWVNETTEWNKTAAYFQVNFSKLKNYPPLYVYESGEIKIILHLKWV